VVILDSNTEDEMEAMPTLSNHALSNSSKGSVNTADDEYHRQRKAIKRPRLTMEDTAILLVTTPAKIP
jgi:CHAD domain-containing protein